MALGILIKMLIEDAVYWSAPTSDGEAGKNFAAPIEIRCRWQDENEQITNVAGEDVMSKAKVFPDRVVDVGGFLFRGKLSDISGDTSSPMDIDDAHEIIISKDLPTLTGDQSLFTAIL